MDLTSFALGALASAVGCGVALRLLMGGKRARFLEHVAFQVASHDAVLDAIAIIRPFGEIAAVLERALVYDSAASDADVVSRLAPLLRKDTIPEEHIKYLTIQTVAECRRRLAVVAKDVGEMSLFNALGSPLHFSETITLRAEVEACSEAIIEALRCEPSRAVNYSVGQAAAELSWPSQDTRPNLLLLSLTNWRPAYFGSRLRPFQALLDERQGRLKELLARMNKTEVAPATGRERTADTAAPVGGDR